MCCVQVWGLGATPYGELGMVEVIRYVQDGNILARQDLCPAEFYNLVMAPCFAQMPDDRPSFSDICTQFTNVESNYRRASTINAAEELFGKDGFTGTSSGAGGSVSTVNSSGRDRTYLQIAGKDGFDGFGGSDSGLDTFAGCEP